MQRTGIDYLTHTLNPIAMRCTRVSDGCRECWHLRTADRLKNNTALPEDERKALAGEGPFVLRKRELEELLRMKTPALIGVQFMGDLFHEGVPIAFIEKVFSVIVDSPQHTFLVLTKRADRMKAILVDDWTFWPCVEGLCQKREYDQTRVDPSFWLSVNELPENIWLGVTICNQREADEKIPLLLQTPAAHRWVSIEPMLGPIDLTTQRWFLNDKYAGKTFDRIDAVVLGGETLGNRPGRDMKIEWAESIVDQCDAADVPVFLKQLHINGQVNKDISEWPEKLRRRELPWCKEAGK